MSPARSVTTSVALALGLALAGCTQFPTEKESVSDIRPQISFRVTGENTGVQNARVLVDGLDAGRVGDFIDGKAALRVLHGNHVITVADGSRTEFEQKVYLSDGVNRAFLVK